MNENNPENVNDIAASVPPENPRNKKLLLWITGAVVLATLVVGGFFLWQQSHPASEQLTPGQNEVEGNIVQEWIGEYEYVEFAPSEFGSNQTWAYVLEVYEEDDQLKAQLDVDGFQTSIRFQTIAEEQDGVLAILFDSYRPQSTRVPYEQGDVLFSLRKVSDNEYEILWSKLQSNLLDPGDARFEKQSSEIDTSNWQTYRNEEFGFEFEYPSRYFVAYVNISETQDENSVVLLKESDREYLSSKEFDDDNISLILFSTIRVEEYRLSLPSLEEIAQEIWPFIDDEGVNHLSCIPKKAIGLDALHCSLELEKGVEFISIDGVLLKHNNRVFVFQGFSRVHDDNIRDDFFEILSTFQFVDSPFADPYYIGDFSVYEFCRQNVPGFSDSVTDIPLRLDKTNKMGVVRLCGEDSSYGGNQTLYVLDDKGGILFSEVSPGPMRYYASDDVTTIDVDKDRTYEVVWREREWSGGKRSADIFSLYSPRFKEKFWVSLQTDWSATDDPDQATCENQWSENLDQGEYTVFKNFLLEQQQCKS